MRRLTLGCTALLLTLSWRVAAQATALCFRAQPKPACSAFLLTNFGSYFVLGQPNTGPLNGLGPLRGVADWGVMVNVGARDAMGASVFASVEQEGFVLGPAVRYRRWFSGSEFLEVAAGTPVTSTTYNVQPGSLFGLVRWGPTNWFSVAARPELVRSAAWWCGPSVCNPGTQWHGRVSLGVEIGGAGGLALTTATGLAALAAVAMIGAAGGN
jgi:hypothetical protein